MRIFISDWIMKILWRPEWRRSSAEVVMAIYIPFSARLDPWTVCVVPKVIVWPCQCFKFRRRNCEEDPFNPPFQLTIIYQDLMIKDLLDLIAHLQNNRFLPSDRPPYCGKLLIYVVYLESSLVITTPPVKFIISFCILGYFIQPVYWSHLYRIIKDS